LKSGCPSKTTKQDSLESRSLIVEKFCDFFSIAPYFATFDKLPLSRCAKVFDILQLN
jgi:hypothetical protein